MTAPAETSSCCATPSANTDAQAIDASCRWPVLGLFKGASVWLVVSSFFGIIASLKFHKATMFADCAWFSYGRTYAVWENALVYGFCVPSALAVGVWLIARLGRVKLCCPVVLTAGAKLWHIGVFIGLLGILYGDSTGYEWLELPRYSMAVLLGSFLLMWYGMRTRQRTVRIIALSLFGLTLLKLFIYDLSGISEGGKVAAFICLGIILLVVSFMYNKLKVLLKEDGGSDDRKTG